MCFRCKYPGKAPEQFDFLLTIASDMLADSMPDVPRSQTKTRRPYTSEEHARIQRRVSGFNWQRSYAWAHLSHTFGPRLNQDELVSIAELTSGIVRIRLDRDARRRKPVMIKWFDENWGYIQPVLRHIVLSATSEPG
jgi:hypothetical protein